MASRNPLIFVFLTVMIDTIGFGIIIPVLPQLIMSVAHVGVSDAVAIGGALLAVFAVLQFLFGPVMGNLSDRFGRRPVLLFSLLAFGVNFALMGLAPNLTWLFIGRALTGISGAVYAPANAFVADVTTPEKRAQSFGLIGAAFGMGFVFGPAIGGFLGEYGPRTPFFVASGLAGVNFLYGFFVLPETLSKERRRPFSLARANPLGTLLAFRGQRTILPLVVAAFFWQLAFNIYPSTWAYFTIAKFNLSPRAIGATLALSGVSMALVQSTLMGRLVRTLGETRTAPLGVAWGAMAFMAYAFIPEQWMMYALLAIGGLQGIAMPSMNALLSKQIGPERQGELQGGMASVMGLCSIIGPPVLTQTLARFSGPTAKVQFPGAAFLLASGFALTSLFLLLRALRREQSERKELAVA